MKHNLNKQSKEKRLEDENRKYMLPKLKSYSQNEGLNYSKMTVTSGEEKLRLQQGRKQKKQGKSISVISKSKEDFNRLGLVKYQYVNKSPNYFKKQFKSIDSIGKNQLSTIQPVRTNFDHRLKDSNRISLFNLLNHRVDTTNIHQKSFGISENDNHQQSKKKDVLSKVQKEGLRLQVFTNSSKNKLIKSKINHNKLKALISQSQYLNSKSSYQESQPIFYQKDIKYPKTIDPRNKQPFILIEQGQVEEKKLFKDSNRDNNDLYETRYSNFQPNKIMTVKNQIKEIKKKSSSKLELYRLQ